MRKQMALSISQEKASSTKWRHHPAELFNTICTTFCHFTKSLQEKTFYSPDPAQIDSWEV